MILVGKCKNVDGFSRVSWTLCLRTMVLNDVGLKFILSCEYEGSFPNEQPHYSWIIKMNVEHHY